MVTWMTADNYQDAWMSQDYSQRPLIVLFHSYDWPVRVSPTQTLLGHDTHCTYLMLDWKMYTYIVHYEKTLKTILQGYKCPAQNFSGENRKTSLEKSS